MLCFQVADDLTRGWGGCGVSMVTYRRRTGRGGKGRLLKGKVLHVPCKCNLNKKAFNIASYFKTMIMLIAFSFFQLCCQQPEEMFTGTWWQIPIDYFP